MWYLSCLELDSRGPGRFWKVQRSWKLQRCETWCLSTLPSPLNPVHGPQLNLYMVLEVVLRFHAFV